MANLLVNPVKTTPTVTGKLQTPNLMANYGLETKFAEISEQNMIKYHELKDTEQILGSEAGIQEGVQDGQDFQLGLKTDDSYYKSPEKFQEFTKRYEDRKAQYQKMAKENGYAADIVTATLEKMDRDYEETKVIHGKYVTDYLKEEEKKRFLLLQDEKDKTISKYMLNRNWKQGIDTYSNFIKSNLDGVKKEQMTMEQAIKLNNGAKTTVLMSDVYSLINEPDGLSILNTYAGMSFEEFNKYYNDLNGQYGDFNAELTYEDYEAWQREVSGTIGRINTRNRAGEEQTLLDKAKAEKNTRDNPVDMALDQFPIETNLNEVIEPFTVMATNNKYGTNFKSMQEIIDNGYSPLTVQGKNSRASQYMDTGLGATDFMQTRLNEVMEYAGGRSVEEQRAIIDGQYNDGTADYIMGYNGTVLYAQGNTNFRYLYDNLYTAENKQILSKVGNVEGDFLSAFKTYEDDFNPVTNTRHNINTMLPGQMSGNPYKNDLGIYKREGGYTQTSLGGKIRGLELAGMNGDKHAERLAKDCKQLIKDTTLLMIMSDNGGLLSEDVADEAGLSDYKNQPIEALTSNQKNKVINAYLEDPGRISKLLGGENAVKKQVREKLTGALQEMTAEVQTIDLGYGRFLNIRPELNGGDVARGIASVLQKQEFYTKDGLIVPGKQIKVVGKVGNDDVLLFYNNEPLMNKNGSRAYINIGGVINE